MTGESVPLARAILERRSVKQFEDRPIDPSALEQILELTLAAPSSFNLQPWRIVVVQDPERRAQLRAAAFGQPQFEWAPVTLVFAVTVEGWREHKERVMTQGLESGAFPSQFEDAIRTSIDGFQAQLSSQELLREYAIKDAMIAATHAALVAQTLGLGSCFMNGWQESQVKTAIGATDPDLAIAVLLPLGYPAHEPKSPGRLPRELTIFDECLPPTDA